MADPAYEEVNNAFERALVFMHKVGLMRMSVASLSHLPLPPPCSSSSYPFSHSPPSPFPPFLLLLLLLSLQMPRIWLDYCQFLMDQCKVTQTRRTFDRALQALPLTQHSRIWPLYVQFIRSHNLPETAIRVYRRYLKVCVCVHVCVHVCDAQLPTCALLSSSLQRILRNILITSSPLDDWMKPQ